jgi:tetratricopeptide (TPR) repeat protein
MKSLTLSKLLLGTAGALFVGAMTIVSTPAAAMDGAVTVLGAGPAELCYQGADSGGDPVEFIQLCNQALNGVLTDHDRAATFINRGVLRLSLAEANAAFDDFTSGLSIDPTIGEGYIDRGAALIERKQYVDAIRDIDKGLSLGAKRPGLAYYDRAVANEGIGNDDAAYKDYQQAAALEPVFTSANSDLKRFKVVRKTVGS